jgi:hypothetical protein
MRSRADIEAAAAAVRATGDDFWPAAARAVDMERFVRGMGVDAILAQYDDYVYSANNYYMYSEPSARRFVFLPHGMDMMFAQPRSVPASEPVFDLDPLRTLGGPGWGSPGRLAVAMRATPALEARFRAEVKQAIALWDVAHLDALAERAAGLLRQADATQPAVRRDLEIFGRRLPLLRPFFVKRRDYLAQVQARL